MQEGAQEENGGVICAYFLKSYCDLFINALSDERLIWAQSSILLMELYHQTIVSPVQSSTALTAHLIPVNPKDEKDKPRQLLIAKTTSL